MSSDKAKSLQADRAVAVDPDPADSGARLLQLAQSHRQAGRLREAAETYAQRAALSGQEEEAWHARLQEARCLLQSGDESGFVRAALAAFEQRPQRAEPLYDLAKYYRRAGKRETALIYCEIGLTIDYPSPTQNNHVEDYVYHIGLKEEYSISANFSKDRTRWEKGLRLCDWLALSRHGYPAAQLLAQRNSVFYAVAAATFLPSLRFRRLSFRAPGNASPVGASIANAGDRLVALVECRGNTSGAAEYSLIDLDAALGAVRTRRVRVPSDAVPPAGAEPSAHAGNRLVWWRGALWAASRARHAGGGGPCRAALWKIAEPDDDAKVAEWKNLAAPGSQERSWLPRIDGEQLQFVESLDPLRVLDEAGSEVSKEASPVAAGAIDGSSALIPFGDGWLCIVRIAILVGTSPRVAHRFLRFDGGNRLSAASRWFSLRGVWRETVGGLAWHPNGRDLLLSLTVEDQEIWLATVSAEAVEASLVELPQLLSVDDLLGRPDPRREAFAREGAVPLNLPAVRSFDLFDTLMARRCVTAVEVFKTVERTSSHAGFAHSRAEAERESGGRSLDDIYRRLAEREAISGEEADRLKALELETEAENFFPIAQYCREVQPRDVVVSDMYLPPAWLERTAREKCGLNPAKFFVLSHGKWTGNVWRTIGRERRVIEHVGDHPYTDGASPRAAGIPARLVRAAQRTAIEARLAEAGFTPLANLIREARLSTWRDEPVLRDAQLAQTQSNFPLLFLATLHLCKTAKERGWDNILMSGRDCYLWQSLYQTLRPMLPGAPPSVYFQTSRSTRAHPSPDYLAYFAQLRQGQRNVVADLCGTGWSLNRLIGQAPQPATDIFLLHHLDLPAALARYERYGGLAAPMAVNAIVARPPNQQDSAVLELLNRAPYPYLEDVRRTGKGYAPVYFEEDISDGAAECVQVHHTAFGHQRELAARLTGDDIAAMLAVDTAPAVAAVYGSMAGMLRKLGPLVDQGLREDPVAWRALEAAANRGRKTEPAAVSNAGAGAKPAGGKIMSRHLRENPFIAYECEVNSVGRATIETKLYETYAQCNEDLIVDSLLRSVLLKSRRQMPSVKYIEIGANHPIQTSSTYLFYRCYGASGVLCEANPDLARQLAATRPRDTVVNAAISTSDQPTIALHVHANHELSSLSADYIDGFRRFGGRDRIEAVIECPNLHINQFMRMHGSGPIDYLSVDVEGLDLELLTKMEPAFQPTIIQCEHGGKVHQFAEVLQPRGYALVALTDVNAIFIKLQALA